MYRTRTLALTTALAATAALAGCSSDKPKPAPTATKTVLSSTELAAGKVALTNSTVAVPSDAEPVITPNGSTTVAVGHATTTSVSGSSSLRAPAGTSLVPIAWSFKPTSSSVDAGAKKTSLVVSAGKKNWLISDDVASGGKVVIAVPNADLENLSPKVVFDNLPQSVDPKTAKVIKASNGAAAYYDGRKLDGGRSSCAPIRQGGSGVGLDFSATCGLVSIDRSPWLPGRGWAAANKQWVTIDAILVPGQMTFTNASKEKVSYPAITSKVSYAVVSGVPASKVTTKGAQSTIIAQTPVAGTFTATVTESYTGTASGTIPADVPVRQTVVADVAANVVFDTVS